MRRFASLCSCSGFASLWSAGCIDYTPKGEHTENPAAAAEISVTPASLDFGGLNFDESADAELTVENIGDATLNLAGFSVQGSSAFAFDDPGETALEPGVREVLAVRYAPLGYTDDGDLLVDSDDPDQPEVRVPLLGAGLFPKLALGNDDVSMGMIDVGCSTGEGVTVTNIGDGRGTISGISVTGDGFSLVTEPELPLVLEAGESVDLAIGFTPSTDGSFTGGLWVNSDDPATPLEGSLTGEGDPLNAATDFFWQGPFDAVDMIITVDQSGSMDDDARKLGTEFSTLIDTLEAAGMDYQVGVVTEDSGCVNDAVFTPDATDAEVRFADAVQLGEGGAYTEAGLTLARNALLQATSGSCNDGLLRDDARTAVVFVSDEPEQSTEDETNLFTQIQAMGTSVIANAVAGPVPGGCGTAEAGRGYDTPVTETGGLFLSICDDDWGDGVAALATATTSEFLTRFPLSATPIPSSLVVEIAGIETTDWVYDEEGNEVMFTATSAPETGEMLSIHYDVAGICD